MKYLIDTNILSELVKKKPDQQVIQWFQKGLDSSLYLSALTLGELRKGIDLLPQSKRRQELAHWLEKDLADWFWKRILPIDAVVAECWGALLAKADRPLSAIDSLIAATAVYNGCTLVTRNTKDFKSFETLKLINPFE